MSCEEGTKKGERATGARSDAAGIVVLDDGEIQLLSGGEGK